jgi:hypothetical protein
MNLVVTLGLTTTRPLPEGTEDGLGTNLVRKGMEQPMLLHSAEPQA